MGGLFGVIVTPAEFGAEKPDPRLFEAALRQAACRPEEAAMVGGRLDNDIAPARHPGPGTVRILRGCGALSHPRDGRETPDHTVSALSELPSLFPQKGEHA